MKIRKISIMDAVPGMIVADDVYTNNNQMIIHKNTTLTDRVITRLRFYSVMEFPILIPDALEDTPPAEEPLKESPVEKEEVQTNFKSPSSKTETPHIFNISTTYTEQIKQTIEFKKYKETFLDTVQEFRSQLNDVVTNDEEINVDQLLTETSRILNESRNSLHLFDLIHCMRDYDDLTYIHCVNVSLISNVIGKWLHFNEEDLKLLTMCGLLHDIGKLTIPQDIIMKPAPLTDEEYSTVKTHTLRGYQILKNKNIDEHIKYSALMHHERCDGSGYPNGFTRRTIDPFAKIVAIADVYDAMTAARVYRGPLCPFEVIHIFEQEGFDKYDPRAMFAFLKGVAQSYIHATVLLSNDLRGTIVMINEYSLSKPIVQVGKNFINLASHPEIKITSFL